MKAKIKLSVFIITLLLAIGAVIWGITSFVDLKSATFKGTITSVQLVNNDNGVGVAAAIIVVRDDEGAKIFELNSSSELISIDGKKSSFYAVNANQKITIKYDTTVSAEHEPAEFLVKSARVTEVKSYNTGQ